MGLHLYWIRSDLRTADNPALHAAMQKDARVEAVYIDCPQQWRLHDRSRSQLEFVERNLTQLDKSFSAGGIRLHRLEVDSFDDVPASLTKLVAERGIDAVHANRESGVYENRRDRAVAERLPLKFELHDAECILPPGSVTTQNGAMYRVFTPFRRAWLHEFEATGYSVLPSPVDAGTEQDTADTAWPAGESAARQRLTDFCRTGLTGYGENRDSPAVDGTSGLSPYLAAGVLSPRQCLQAIEEELGYLPMSPGETGFEWLNELVWREFYRHLMAAFPQLSMNQPFLPAARGIRWNDDDKLFAAWCEGRTGYPIVDAAMRCLNETGWMHNRLRMIVASFLVKDLLIDWRRGEAYFMSRLIDGDFPSNNGGWQWSAGTGADAAPYFRIFNPTTQGERYDPDGAFIRGWLPELDDAPGKHVHRPHAWLVEQGRTDTYPEPIVDHKEARERCLARYQVMKSAS